MSYDLYLFEKYVVFDTYCQTQIKLNMGLVVISLKIWNEKNLTEKMLLN